MRALVTGGCGFIGSHIVEELLSRGDDVVVIDDESADENHEFYKFAGVDYHKLDICDDSTAVFYHGVDAVFHLAAKSRIQPTIQEPSPAFQTNIMGTQRVLEFALRHKVKKVIYSSSSSCYGHRNQPPHYEDMIPDCQTPYSLSKKQGEELCHLYSKLFGLSTITLRYFNVYGPREPLKGQYAPVIGLFKSMREKGDPLTVVGDGEQRRDFTYVKDVVSANLMAAKSPIHHDLFNIGTGRNFSINEVANLVGGEIKHISSRMGEARETLANISKATQILGWSPEYKLEDTVLSY
jgi:UDP-glucose 4-epimerase